MSPLEKKRTVVTLRSDGYEVVVEGNLLATPQNHVIILPTNRLAEAIAKEWDIFLFEREAREQRYQFHQKLSQEGEAGSRKEIKIDAINILRQADTSFSAYLGHVEAYSYETLPPLTHLAALAVDWSLSDDSFLLSHLLEGAQEDAFLQESFPAPSFLREDDWDRLKGWYQETYGSNLEKALKEINWWSLTILYKLTQVTGSLFISLCLMRGKLEAGRAFSLAEISPWIKEAPLMKGMTIGQKKLFLRTQLIVCCRFLSLLKEDQSPFDLVKNRVEGSMAHHLKNFQNPSK